MKNPYATRIGPHRKLLAAAIALALSSPVYANAPVPPTSRTAADRSAASESTPADNSARNARDVARDGLTPLDQSHADKDVEMTRSIRKRLADDDTLGTNARNVKVITVDGMVTLRGPVANADEQARIVAIAKQAAGVDHVVNDLQVTRP